MAAREVGEGLGSVGKWWLVIDFLHYLPRSHCCLSGSDGGRQEPRRLPHEITHFGDDKSPT